MASTASVLRHDLLVARTRDQRHATTWTQWKTRVDAVITARVALETGETGAAWALRQAMIDLAAISEELAAGLPCPTVRAA